MKKNSMLLFVCLVVLSNFAFSQIKVTSAGNVSLGIGNTNTLNPIDIVGATFIHPMNGADYIKIGYNYPSNAVYINPSSNYKGYLGFGDSWLAVNAKYIYGTNILYSSDEKLKKNIHNLDTALPIIKKLRPVTFDYDLDYSKVEEEKLKQKLQDDDKRRLGFIAQEVQKILPQSVKVNESDSTLCIQLIDFIPILVKGMQEQTTRIDSLKSVIDELKYSQTKLKSASIAGVDKNLNSITVLDQNIPNPFSQETNIGCTIPESSTSAVLYIYNMNGTQLQQHNINGKGKQMVPISGSSLEPGMYLYALVVDGIEVDTKRMILTK
jgi:hypothetical protein